ncbi:aminoacyl-tRNA hydrolase [Planctomycetales bacterium ZRK34]|nr:aminoacyl-tRNA hydrolase [Planctomycetales bacterium ZRK34]
MKLIVGLGNPGAQYRATRHNAGFMVLDELAQRHPLGEPRSKFHAAVLEGVIRDQRIMLMQPQTFMNRSGLAVGEAARFFKLELSDVIVVVDDIALPTGTIRLRPGGGAGGHNGLSDITRALGSDQYPRLRVGVDAPMVAGRRVNQSDYVLSPFHDEQKPALEKSLRDAAEAVECWIAQGLDAAMTRYNARTESEN